MRSFKLTAAITAVIPALFACSPAGADVTALEAALPEAGVDAFEPTDAIAEAIGDRTLQHTREIVDGVTMLYFGDATGSTIVLATEPDARSAYVLPSGPNLKFNTAAGEPIELGAVLDEPVVFCTTDKGWGFVEYRMTLVPTDPQVEPVTGADVDEAAVVHTIEATPETTLKAAFDEARPLLARGEGVRIAVAPGLYREGGLSLPDGDATLVIEGTGEGPSVITGGDDFSGGWELVEGSENVYQKDWPHKFGLGPQNWARWNFLLAPGTSRSEVVTVDGVVMMPVDIERFRWVDPDGAVPLDEADSSGDEPGRWELAGRREPASLVPGSFGVDESAGKLYVCPPEGVDLNGAAVEAAVRGPLLTIEQRSNYVLRNLEFRHAVSYVGRHDNPVSLGGSNYLVEGCRFVENGSRGLGLRRSPTDVTIRDSVFNGNGWKGMAGGYLPRNLLIENVETSHNNWRGHSGGQHGWDAAGIKIFGINDTVAVRGHKAFGNLTHGLWLDQSFTPFAPITVSDSIYAGNVFGADLYLEKLTGPVLIEDNVVFTDRGLHSVNGTSWDMTFRGNLFYVAQPGQPVFFLHTRGEESEYAVSSRDWTIEGNVFVAENDADIYMPRSTPEQFEAFLGTVESTGNLYHIDDPDDAFPDRDEGQTGLDAWREMTGQDADAVVADPRLADPSAYDWTPGSDEARSRLGGLPEMSDEDRRKLEHALAESARYMRIVAASQPSGGPAFDRALQTVDNNWHTIDLSGVVNRPVTGDDAWIGAGNQLTQLPGGRQRYAGVPFEIVPPDGDADAAVALRSGKITDAPETVEVPVGRAAEAVYVLHGGGWFDGDSAPVGRYELVYADGTSAGIDVVPEAPDADAPLVGEWYHSFTPFDGDSARHVALQGPLGKPGAYLYVVEIENPHPDREVKTLRLTGNPDRDVSLLILGASLVTP